MVEKYKEVDEFGNVYKGDVLNGKFHGKGTLLYAESGDVYHGDFENGVPHGSGKFLRDGGKTGVKDGVYEGLWNNGVLQQVKKGRAKIALDNGDVYEGGFHHWKRHGMGKLIQNDGEVYDGQWKEGMKHGPGRIEYPDGAFFDGNFRDDEAVVVKEGRDHVSTTSNELDLNPYRSTERRERHVPDYSEEDLKPKEGVPRTISFHSASVERGNESVSRYGDTTVEQPEEGTKKSIKNRWRDRSVSRGKAAGDVEEKRLQLERLKDGKCLRKFAEKTIVKLEKKDDSEKKKGFFLFRGKKKQKEEESQGGYDNATEQYVNDYVDSIPEFFDFALADGPSAYQMEESKPPPKRLSTPRGRTKEIPSTRAKSPLPRSSSRRSGRQEEPAPPTKITSKNRLPSKPHVGSNTRGRSKSSVQRESSHSRGRPLSTPRQPQTSSRERSSSRARERPPSSRRETSERTPIPTHDISSSRPRGRSSSRQTKEQDNRRPSTRERSKSKGHERSTSKQRLGQDRAGSTSRQRPGQDPGRSTSRQRSGQDRARSSSRARERSSSRPRASQERTSSRARDTRNPGDTMGEKRIPRQRSMSRNRVPIDSKTRKEALMKKYNQGHLYNRDSVQSKTSQRSDSHTLKSINMKGKSGTAQMLYVNDEDDDDSKYFLR
mmetsp:Transcript_12700/g.19046  ORF Transcript_12700/g.19046 Transcript_12700/m.19046 type:complete len:659 (-) Transcript_12700:229-2205(-)